MKVAFITGGGGYIGTGVANEFAKQGVAVAVCDIIPGNAEKTAAAIRNGGVNAKAYEGDVTDSASIEAAMARAKEDFGRIDIMVHVAGGSARIAGPNAKYLPLVEQEDYVIETVLKVNLLGAIYASRAAARIMIAQGQGGKIVNFSSAVGINGLKSCVDYAAAKGGVMSMTKALAKELGQYRITVNSVAPGIVMRPEETGGDERAQTTNFLGQKCLPQDVANLVCFLCSDKADFITGQTYVIDGGRSLAMKGTD